MDKKQCLVEIYKVEAGKYNASRDIQWKINVAVWTVMFLAVYSKIQKPFTINKSLLFAIAGLFVVLHFLFIKIMHESQKRSLSRLNNIATFLIEKEENESVSWQDMSVLVPNLKLRENYLQVLITIFLVAIFFYS
jgi:hypothetical protein